MSGDVWDHNRAAPHGYHVDDWDEDEDEDEDDWDDEDDQAAYDAAEESDAFLEACRTDTTEFDLMHIRHLEQKIAHLEQDIEELNEELADLLADPDFYR